MPSTVNGWITCTLVCQKNGLTLDQQNRNPSRLSRMPGIVRRGKKQYLLATNLGKACWEEWRDWVEACTDDLPDTECMADVWGALPPLADPLIENVLRKGHKLLLAGPSKAGKGFALSSWCICIAEGKPWLGRFNCAQGKVLYINLELDRASCLHRFKDVYDALGYQPDHVGSIDVWNLRGASVPMDKLAPRLIRRAAKKGYLAVVLDPIYKVITGDENSADHGQVLQPVRPGLPGVGVRRHLLPPPFQGLARRQEVDGPRQRFRCVRP